MQSMLSSTYSWRDPRGQFCPNCASYRRLNDCNGPANTAKGAIGEMYVRLELARIGFATSVPFPDEGEDLWFARMLRDERSDFQNVCRAQVKSVHQLREGYYLVSFPQNSFDRVRDLNNFFILIAINLNKAIAKDTNRNETIIGVFTPRCFAVQPWFKSVPKYKDKKTKNYNVRFFATPDGRITAKGENDFDPWDCTERFQHFAMQLEAMFLHRV